MDIHGCPWASTDIIHGHARTSVNIWRGWWKGEKGEGGGLGVRGWGGGTLSEFPLGAEAEFSKEEPTNEPNENLPKSLFETTLVRRVPAYAWLHFQRDHFF